MSDSVVQDVLWTEKYRPEKLQDMALEPETRKILQSYLDAGEIPHLLLIGPPGSGKTTVSRILVTALDCRQLALNASSERGIDVVREKIGTFITALTAAKWNIVFLDEADAMTSDAQTAMRNQIESYADHARFILTANYPHRIIPAIQSRCQVLTLGQPPVRERARVLAQILKAEGVKIDPKVVFAYAEKFPDLRGLLWAAQRSFLSHGELIPMQSVEGSDGDSILGCVVGKNWTAIRRLTSSGDFDPLHALRDLFHAIPDDHPRVGFLRHVVGRGVHESAFTPDPVILFLSVCAEAMEGL